MSIEVELESLRGLSVSEPSAERIRARLNKRRRRRRVLATAAGLAAIAIVIGAVVVSADDDVTVETADTGRTATRVDPNSIAALTSDGNLVELSPRGEVEATIADLEPLVGSGGLAVSPDGRSIYVGARLLESPPQSSNCTSEVRRVDVENGTSEVIATQADSPAVSADGRLLAYVALRRQSDICYRKAIVVRHLASGDTESFPYPAPGVPDGPSPISWSPGASIASIGDAGATLLNVYDGEFSPVRAEGRPLLPTFVDRGRLAVLLGCCTGDQSMQIVNLDSGDTRPWLTLDVPLDSLAVGPDLVGLAVTAEGKLVALGDGSSFEVVADGYRHVARPTAGGEDEEDPSGSDGPCERVDRYVPTPNLRTAGRSVNLDYLWTNHTCGFAADGAANLGAELNVIVIGDTAVLDVAPRFDVRTSLTAEGSRPEFDTPRRDDDGLITVGPLPQACSELTVDLAYGGLTGQFAARLALAEGDCT